MKDKSMFNKEIREKTWLATIALTEMMEIAPSAERLRGYKSICAGLIMEIHELRADIERLREEKVDKS